MNFSIIVPHKNIPNLLERLIDSIPIRNDLEIVIVDDRSEASVIDKVRLFCSKRNNVILKINQGLSGAGFARNYGISLARGKWLIFADADDFFHPEFNEFLDRYKEDAYDAVYFNADSVDTNTYKPSNRADHLHDFFNEYSSDKKHGELIMRFLFTEPWCKMIKRDLIINHNITFDNTKIHEDVKFSCLVGFFSNKMLFVDEQLYCVTSREDSLSRTQTLETFLDELSVFARWKKFLLDRHIPLELPKFEYRAYNFSRHLYKDNKLFRQEYRVLRKAGYSNYFILCIIVKYLKKSFQYKFC